MIFVNFCDLFSVTRIGVKSVKQGAEKIAFKTQSVSRKS